MAEAIRKYEISVQCRNCRNIPMTEPERMKPKKFLIPRGNTVVRVLQEMECEYCGCTGYMGLL